MKGFALVTLFSASAFAIGTNEFDSYFYDQAFFDWEDAGLSTSWNDDNNPLRVGGAGDINFNLMDWSRSDKEGKYLSGSYGPSIDAFFQLELDVYVIWGIDFNLKAILNGFKLIPLKYKFVDTFGEKKCYYFSTEMSAATFDLIMQESIAEYYFSLADYLVDGTVGSTVTEFIRFNPAQSEYVKWPSADHVYQAWQKEFKLFDFCL